MGFRRWWQARRTHRDRRRILRELPGCGACGHAWEEHDGAWGELEGESCGECRYESDHGEGTPGDECRGRCPLLTPRQVEAFRRLSGAVPGDPASPPVDEREADHRHLDSWLAGVLSSQQVPTSHVRDLSNAMETDTGRAFVTRLAAVLANSDAEAGGSS